MLSTFVAKFKINFPGNLERDTIHVLPWERGFTVHTHPQVHLRIQDGERAVWGAQNDPRPWT